MSDGLKNIETKLLAFKRKYYLNLFIKGFLLTASIILAYFILATITEYNFWLNGYARLVLFVLFILLIIFCSYRFFRDSIIWFIYKKGLSKEESATLIGKHFSTVNDRLLNLLQLSQTNQSTDLANASIIQRAGLLENISFETAIDLKGNRKYLNYLLIPFTIALIVFFINKNIFTESTKRIVNFREEYSPAAPFHFNVLNSSLNAFANEDFTLKVSLEGKSIPDAAYILVGDNKSKLVSSSDGTYTYLFEKIQNDITFQLNAAGFSSKSFQINLINRPELTQLKIRIKYPRYLNLKETEIVNSGNIEIPEGSDIAWKISTLNTQKASMLFSSENQLFKMESSDNQIYNINKNFNNPDNYSILLENENSKNKESIAYSISVTKDKFPEISVRPIEDSILFKQIYFTGDLKDDYGLTALTLFYKTDNRAAYEKKNIPINFNFPQQGFYHVWSLDSIHLKPGSKLSYYLEVWDNDGVNGRKSTKTPTYTFSLPDGSELKTDISKDQAKTTSKFDDSIDKAKKLKESIEEEQQKLKGKQNLDWQDKKKLEEIIHQKENLAKAIDELQKQNKLLEQKKETFSKENESIKTKSEQIQKLMNELMNEEMKKLFEELQKLMKENADPTQLQKMLEKIDRKEIDLEKELERTLELFKDLQFDYKLDQAIKEIEEQIKDQEKVNEKTNNIAKEEKSNENKPTENANDKGNPTADSVATDQKSVNEKLDDFKKTVDELQKLNDELDKSTETPSKEDLEEINQEQKKSVDQLNQKQSKSAAESQQKALKKMKQIQKSLESSQNSMEMEINEQNLESLRQAIHGLIKLSFDQEQTMKDFGTIQQTDPKYLTLSQNQLKIEEDSKVLEDSLLAIAKRDPFMGGFVTKEVGELNDHFKKASENIKERKKQNASAEMQFSMAGINNLALMLDDHYNAMMEMMAKAKPGKGKSKKKGKQPNLSQIQQKINEKINELKKGGSGQAYSEELARLAAEQERIRHALEEMENKLKQEGGKVPGGNLGQEMEKTEMDLVNKQITEQTIKRQQEILTRLLETEKSLREKDEDEERKAETAKEYSNEIPKALEDYLKSKEKEIELLKTIPAKLFPYYRKEVDNYFKRLDTNK